MTIPLSKTRRAGDALYLSGELGFDAEGKIPDGIDDARARKFMENRFKVLIAGAFGFDIVRIGQMGEQCRAPNLFRTLHALGVALARQNVAVDPSTGMAAMEAYLAEHAEDVL